VVFDHIIAGYRAGDLPVPWQVWFEPRPVGTNPMVSLMLAPGDSLGVDRWAAHFGLPGAGLVPRVYELSDVSRYRMYESASDCRPLEVVGPDGTVMVVERGYTAEPALWNGWDVYIGCRVPMAAAAEAAAVSSGEPVRRPSPYPHPAAGLSLAPVVAELPA
jgi:hypothetical protein